MQTKIISKLQELTNHKYIKLTKRGNKAILYALKIAKNLGKTKILIPDQGGWIAYYQYPDKLKLDKEYYETDYGVIKLDKLKLSQNTALILNNPAGYFAEQPLELTYNYCNHNHSLLILDASGSIGTDGCNGIYADIIIASFGWGKPVNLGAGGFISTNSKHFFDNIWFEEVDLDYSLLLKKLNQVEKRQKTLRKIARKIKDDLKHYNILHKDREGINVIVKYKYPKEKSDLIVYCKKNNLEYTECPRYIRIQEKAISIEVKRVV